MVRRIPERVASQIILGAVVAAPCFLSSQLSSGATPATEASSPKPTLQPRVLVETSLGPIVIMLEGEKAPGTTLNFVKYVQAKYYEGTIFHRVIKDFMIQGGSYLPDLTEKADGLRPPIKNEWRNRLKNVRGSVAMARLGNQPDSARASFFINVVDNPYLDKPMDGSAYAVFGKVIEGMETVEKIRTMPVRADSKLSADPHREVVPVDPVVIRSMTMLDPLDEEKTKDFLDAFDEYVSRLEAKAKTATADAVAERIQRIESEMKTKFTKTESGLMYLDIEEGKGTMPLIDDAVLVHYIGTFADGSEFDNSRSNPDLLGEPAKFEMVRLIKGFMEGLLSMKVGGKRILVVPPELGWEKGRKGIPPNSTLFYEIELIGFAGE